MRWLLPLILCAGLARADGEPSGDFDYYVLSLGWSPTWCALEGDARQSPQCDRPLGWVLHGLWPQYHRGYPAHCPTTQRPPSRAMTSDMADIMGTAGLAWHEWHKHGVCTGLSARDYFALSRKAYDQVMRPAVLRALDKPVTLPASVIEEAFLKANDGWEPDMVTITCRDGRIQEARLCLSKDLVPVPCGQDVVRDCTLNSALVDPVR
ncbi:ribonuclease T [Salipiger aestuarii]|uniref:Ribonuclease T2 n=1 Tax=Salipiger aestuarii TaxID=568098 RepID=A0A327YIJ3_9RHOB|nr:ribonuclease T2 [Salipiger aestuarii]EIE50438.1 ribonuclease T2 [Citreicella sp. 357]KAA8609297.1 ribonuclease T [Salipiger aestuarii]KAA8615166.1 ribonuclease T [Salipiger aestuarii]KAB2542909.1 ribonuclease T [Salipiger aestuarii]RAK20828.1 ribonuclease T2 [Salipiger aestuarii]